MIRLGAWFQIELRAMLHFGQHGHASFCSWWKQLFMQKDRKESNDEKGLWFESWDALLARWIERRSRRKMMEGGEEIIQPRSWSRGHLLARCEYSGRKTLQIDSSYVRPQGILTMCTSRAYYLLPLSIPLLTLVIIYVWIRGLGNDMKQLLR